MYYEITNLQRNFTKQLKKNINSIQNIAYIAKHPPKLQLNLIDNIILITARIDHMLYSYFKTFGILELADNAIMHNNNINFYGIEVLGFDDNLSLVEDNCLLGNLADKYNMLIDTCITENNISLISYKEYILNHMDEYSKSKINLECNRIKNVYEVEGVIILKYQILSYDKTRFIEDCKVKI